MDEKIKFAASYSGGKDSALALYRAIQNGFEPVSLLTTYNKNDDRSWFHGVPTEVLYKVSELTGIPLKLVATGDDYGADFESALIELIDNGVNACVFGDIDIQEHYDWSDLRCKHVGIKSCFPLWNGNRSDLVYESIEKGFKAVIIVVDTARMSERFLGKTLTRELVDEIAGEGVDICGENGEYHTFVYDGPIFKSPVEFELNEIHRMGNYSSMPLTLK
ncbi:MAG: diphthine--ammonia ligase [Clostridioides sp.]|jgi:uncharacterized protein (TIGR00290 family)|nr:diphthine--ammonia ligase [Clostridioides sp.]